MEVLRGTPRMSVFHTYFSQSPTAYSYTIILLKIEVNSLSQYSTPFLPIDLVAWETQHGDLNFHIEGNYCAPWLEHYSLGNSDL